jgi:hypothetical protein
MIDLLRTINRMRNVADTQLNFSIKKVIVILSSPRSGSSLVKSILSAHPEIASLDGEIEPFLALSGNGFGYSSKSDAIGKVTNLSKLVANIFDDLTLPTAAPPALEHSKRRWRKRLLLQFPVLFAQDEKFERLVRTLDAVLTEENARPYKQEAKLRDFILSNIFSSEPWRLSYYDGHKQLSLFHSFNEPVKIEEPPFITPRNYRRQFCQSDVDHKVLLFKSPPDAFRIGMYEQLFPHAEIQYIHLTRGFAQTVNGLMDGWLSPVGFFSHDFAPFGIRLHIKDYSDVVQFGSHWWKFDLPPNWEAFTSATLEDVCLNQWMSTNQSVISSGVPVLRIAFEDFVVDPKRVIDRITEHCGLAPLQLQLPLPVTMATDKPIVQRWKKRERQLLKIAKRTKVKEMMESINYEMNPETWI